MEVVIVTVAPNGETKIEADGIVGTQCIMHTNPYIMALGKIVKQSPKPEMYDTPTTTKVEAHQ